MNMESSISSLSSSSSSIALSGTLDTGASQSSSQNRNQIDEKEKRCGLIIGGTQFIGRAIVEELLNSLESRHDICLSLFSSLCIINRGKSINPFQRTRKPKIPESSTLNSEIKRPIIVEHICCDVFNDEEQLIKIISSRKWAFIVHMLLFSEDGAKHLYSGLQKMHSQFNNAKDIKIIMISTDSIYESCNLKPGKIISEEDSVNRLTRKTKRRSTTGYQYDYGSGKLNAENYLLSKQNEFPSIIILRLPDVIGEHDNLGSFLDIIEIIERGKPLPGHIFSNETVSASSLSSNIAVEVSSGDVLTHRISLVYSRDVAKLVNEILLLPSCDENKLTLPLVLNVSCDETPTVYEFYEMIYSNIGTSISESSKRDKGITIDTKKDCPIPTVAFGPISNKRLRSLKEIKWLPTPLHQVISNTCSWYLSSTGNRNETKKFADGSSSSSSDSS